MNIATLFPLCINYGPLSKTPPESLYRNNTGIVRLLNNPDFKPRVKHPRALRTRRPQHAVDHPAEGTGRNVGARSAAQPTSRDSAPTREALMHSEGAGSFAATPTPLSSEDASEQRPYRDRLRILIKQDGHSMTGPVSRTPRHRPGARPFRFPAAISTSLPTVGVKVTKNRLARETAPTIPAVNKA